MRKNLILLLCLASAVFSAEFDASKINSYLKECNQNRASGCFYVGIAYFLGDGLNKDDKKALDFFKKANKLEPNNAFYISTIAHVYYYRYKTDDKAALLDDAVKLFTAACKLKDAASCYELGEIYNYENDKRDYSKAASYYKQSCNLQNMDGCLKLRNLKNK
ncbi:MAG: sel1 repeat family protein [Campylobacteraceae bacterium]|jgi:TPR repeat protein|nr:sel1 repeat family protein [Campylobacteraceae bacterium]